MSQLDFGAPPPAYPDLSSASACELESRRSALIAKSDAAKIRWAGLCAENVDAARAELMADHTDVRASVLLLSLLHQGRLPWQGGNRDRQMVLSVDSADDAIETDELRWLAADVIDAAREMPDSPTSIAVRLDLRSCDISMDDARPPAWGEVDDADSGAGEVLSAAAGLLDIQTGELTISSPYDDFIFLNDEARISGASFSRPEGFLDRADRSMLDALGLEIHARDAVRGEMHEAARKTPESAALEAKMGALDDELAALRQRLGALEKDRRGLNDDLRAAMAAAAQQSTGVKEGEIFTAPGAPGAYRASWERPEHALYRVRPELSCIRVGATDSHRSRMGDMIALDILAGRAERAPPAPDAQPQTMKGL